jgi:DNA-binding NarL/FixJ family response regulator
MRSVRILLVDDSPDFLDCAARFLAGRPEMKVVGLARSGEEAVESAQKLSPDLVLMDLAMPRMNGIEATRQIKARPQSPCIIIISLHNNVEYRTLARTAGADEMISKENFANALFPAIERCFPNSVTTRTITNDHECSNVSPTD